MYKATKLAENEARSSEIKIGFVGSYKCIAQKVYLILL